MDLTKGAKEAIERVCRAYGFTSRVQLADHIGISGSSLANRITRDNYPTDIVLRCALETGAPLHWLATGELKDGEVLDHAMLERGAERLKVEAARIAQIPTLKLHNHMLVEDAPIFFDRELMPTMEGEIKIIKENDSHHIVQLNPPPLTDGFCLIEYSNQIHLREITNIPGNKISIDLIKFPIDCDATDVKVLGKVLATFAELK